MSSEDDALLSARTALAVVLRDALSVSVPLPDGPLALARLPEALTHPSYANETGGKGDNQRLEFLGDSVLSVCVSELLIVRYPHADEGLLTRMRSALVNAEALAAWARSVNLGSAMAFGRGARLGGERLQTNVLADAVEAIVAAVYHEFGFEGARAVVLSMVEPHMVEEGRLSSRDPKSELQERVQALGFDAPRYRLRAALGPDHAALFEIEVVVDSRVLGVGSGRSKRIAERKAAERALEQHVEDVLLAASETSEPSETPGIPGEKPSDG
jgi:ribonuclease III